MQGGPEWEEYIPIYHDPWIRLGVKEVLPIVPTSNYTLDDNAFEKMKGCTGIFIAGGETRKYQSLC